MRELRTFQIKREGFVVGLLFLNSILNGFTGILFMFMPSKRVEGVCQLLLSLLSLLLAFWAKRTPYVRITPTEIQIFRLPFYPLVCIDREQIKDISLKKYKVVLFL